MAEGFKHYGIRKFHHEQIGFSPGQLARRRSIHEQRQAARENLERLRESRPLKPPTREPQDA